MSNPLGFLGRLVSGKVRRAREPVAHSESAVTQAPTSARAPLIFESLEPRLLLAADPLGITAGLWTQMWGLVYGEFRGSPRKAYVALAGGIILYIIGAYLIAPGSQEL